MVENKLINGYEPALVRLYGARDSVEISEQMAAALCGNRILALGREALQLAQDPVGGTDGETCGDRQPVKGRSGGRL